MPIIEKRCLRCQAPFATWARPRREQRFCSRACADKTRSERLRKRVRKPLPTTFSQCAWCGVTFEHRRDKQRQFCGKRCSSRARWSDPGRLARVSERARNKTAAQRSASSQHMAELNRDPSVRARMAAALRGRTFSGQRGGNGALTPQQIVLQQALGWSTEFCVPTGQRSWPCARVDLAEPTLKIAIEVDGASHHTLKQRNRDARKSAMLTALGWTVLRFWNSEIDQQLPPVLARVHAAVQARSSRLSA